MLPLDALAHADPTSGPRGLAAFLLPLLTGGLVVFVASRLFRGPLGESNVKRFRTLAVLIAVGVVLLWGADRVIPH